MLWIAVSVAFLAMAHFAYRFADPGMSRRRLRKARKAEEVAQALTAEPHLAGLALPAPVHGAAAGCAQFLAQTRLEMRQIFRSPAFPVLLALGLLNAIGALWFGDDTYGTPTYPLTFTLIPLLEGTFTITPLIVAIYYSGESVWRDRDRKMHEIIDATPLPNWAFAIPKTLAVALILLATLAVSVLAALLIQLLKGHTNFELGKYLLWYVLPLALPIILRTMNTSMASPNPPPQSQTRKAQPAAAR